MSNASGSKKRENINPRRLKFATEYLRIGNALQAARAAGYSERYALTHSYMLARSIRTSLEKVARALGVTEQKIIEKYLALIEAKTAKWNPKDEMFESFDDGKIQLEATRDLAEIIEPRESKISTGLRLGQNKDGRPTLQVILHHTVGRPDRSKQAVKQRL